MIPLDPITGLVLVGAGLVAGFFNTVAGGGSLLTLPALMLAGLPADVANGTNRLSVLTQSVAGVGAYAKEGRLAREAILPVLAPTVSGSFLGALVASQVPEEVLRVVLLAMLVLVAALLGFFPKVITPAEGEEPRTLREHPVGALGLFATGLYGGFVQAGVGFLLLSVIGGMLRFDLVRANALKLVCTTVFGVVALAVFVAAGQVAWVPGLVLAGAAAVGSRVGVSFATRVPAVVLRRVLLVAVIASCLAAYLEG